MNACVSTSSFRRPGFVFSILIAAAFCLLSSLLLAQEATSAASASVLPPQPLITQAIDETQLTTLKGNTHPLARSLYDLGTAQATLPLQRMLLVLKRSPQQESALRKLLDDQQNKNSSNYHHWLAPEDFGKQFGPTDTDIQTITAWLQSHGFQVGTTKGRTVLEFSGSASQVQETFHTAIHKYLVNGDQHWANASDPQIPSALVPAIAGIDSLNDFPRKPMYIPAGTYVRQKGSGIIRAQNPQFTFPGGCVEDNEVQSGACDYGVGPYDFATIYNVLPLWNQSPAINGTGQHIAIVAESNINPQDVASFRLMFGLAANAPNIILNGPDPGLQGDESEADIDSQWSGAVAPNATIDFVVSQTTETTAGIDLSAYYIIENNLDPVMSESYGYCELGLGTAGNQFYSNLWQQAAAQGITAFVSAGDNGSAGCDDFDANPPSPAQYGLEVSGFASTPYNVAVGGTDFNDFTDPATYWSTTNNSTTQASALSYIPEIPWNDSCTNPVFATIGYSPTPEVNCNNSNFSDFVRTVGGSGGASNCTTPSGGTPATCAGGYARPSWQTGNGTFSSDGKRDIPDVALFASNGFLGQAYIFCESDQTDGICNLNSSDQYFLGVGGTSVSSPAFAGIMALVNQYDQQNGGTGRQGNANYVLYKLATQQTSAFHDITTGTNAMPCTTGSPNCLTNTAGDSYGVLSGYNAGTGYDLASGLGSVNAQNLVTKWNSITLAASATNLTATGVTTITHGQPFDFSVTVQPKSGTGAAPTGQISLIGGPSTSNADQSSGGFALTTSGTSGTFSGSTDMLPGGTYSLTANYPGDSNYNSSTSSPVSVTVNKENSEPQVFLVTFNSSNNIVSSNTTTATYGSPYILRVNVENSAGQMCNPAASTAATACPTGTVAMTDNGSSLDAGTYTLNSYGYFEDETVQLPGGTNSVKAAYAGDNSFSANTITTPLTITPAATSMGTVSVANLSVGATFSGSVNLGATSSGAAPTGTVTFLVNGTAVSGNVSYYGTAGSASNPSATLSASLLSSTSPFSTAGSYNIGASYSGDQNYAASSAPTQSITVQYPIPMVTLSPATQDVNPGATANVTVLVDTSDKTTYPTGTITFVNQLTGGVVSGPTTCASTKDSSGNYACQVVASFTVTSALTVQAQYSGDTNYPANSGVAQIVVNDFSLSAGSTVTMMQGTTGQTTVNVSALGNFNATVSNFSCSGLPAEATCSFSPTSVSGGQGSTTLTITTAAVGQLRHRAANETPRLGWMAFAIMPALGICLIGIPARNRKKGLLTALMIVGLIAVLPSCGGSGGGGGGGQTNNPVPSISSLSPTQQAAGSASQVLTINGSGFIAGSTVTYNGVAHIATYGSASQLTTTLSANDMAATGSFPVIVTNPTPGGGASGAVNFNVVSGTPTGNFNVTVTATSGSLTHNTSFTLTIQ
jgi:Pro-kumamolisin, activation domain/Bacterial Ig-like domain (group 3)